jgi:hypothetical protein
VHVARPAESVIALQIPEDAGVVGERDAGVRTGAAAGRQRER